MDPNEVVGTPTERQIWLSPDWSKHGVTAAVAGPGSTQVWTRTVTYRNGRQVTYVLDENHNPITHQVLSEDVNADVKKAWDDAQHAQTPTTGQMTTREMRPDGQYHIMGWDPNGAGPGKGAYTIDMGIAAAPATTPHTEGTPVGKDAAGNIIYDNTRPIVVNRDANNQQIGAALPLTGEPLNEWERNTNEAAGRGRFTNAELAARGQSATVRTAVDGHPGVWLVTVKDGAGNITPHYENNAGQTITQPEDVKTQIVTDGHGNQVAVIVHPDGRITTAQTGLAGAPPTLNANGTIYQLQPDNTYKPAPGIADPNAGLPPGAPKLDLSTADSAYSSFMRYYEWAMQQVANGSRSPDWLKTALEGPHTAADMAIQRENVLRQQQQQQIGNALTERAQDITLGGGRLSAATTGFGNALQQANATNLLAGPGINAAASTLLGTLALQRINAQAMGGMKDYPSVLPGPVANLPTYPGAAAPAAAAPAAAQPTLVTPAFKPPPPASNIQPAAPAAAAAAAAAPAVATAPAPAAPVPAPIQPAPAGSEVTGATPDEAAGVTRPQSPSLAPTPQLSVPVPYYPGTTPDEQAGVAVPQSPSLTAPPAVDTTPTPAAAAAPAPAEDMVTIRNRITGAVLTYPRSKWNNAWTFGIWEEVPPGFGQAGAASAPMTPTPDVTATPAPQPPTPDVTATPVPTLPPPYSSSPAERGFQPDSSVRPGGAGMPPPDDSGGAPTGMGQPVYPAMALSRSMGGGGYDPAIAAMKGLGISSDTIAQAMRGHLMGVSNLVA